MSQRERQKRSTSMRLANRTSARSPSDAFKPDPPPPVEEYQRDLMKVERRPSEMSDEELFALNPDSDDYPGSRKLAHWNPFSPSVVRAEQKRRLRARDEKKYLDGVKEGSADWVKVNLFLEGKYGPKTRDRLKALELLGRVHKLFTEVIEVQGAMSQEDKEKVAKEAIEDYLKSLQDAEIINVETKA